MIHARAPWGSLLYRLYPLWRFYVIITILLRHAAPYVPPAVRALPREWSPSPLLVPAKACADQVSSIPGLHSSRNEVSG